MLPAFPQASYEFWVHAPKKATKRVNRVNTTGSLVLAATVDTGPSELKYLLVKVV